MTKHLAALLLTLPALLFAGTSHAYLDGWYLGGTAHLSRFDDSDVGVDLDLGVLGFLGGYRFNRFLAVEGSFRAGVRDDSIQDPFFGEIEVGLDTHFAASAVARLPVTAWLDLYGKLGYGRSSFDLRGFAADFTETDVSFGGGVHAQLGTVLVRAGYERLVDSGSVRFDGFELAVIFELM